jgi:serine protease AprX
MLAVSMVLAAAALGGVVPAEATVSNSSGQWLWEGTARTVNNVRDDTGFGLLPKNVSLTGKGVGIALIDTGVTPVPGLTSGNVVNGPDLSFDSQDPAKRYVDGFGHGTHLAGIISARTTQLTGLAPDAKLTSIKVADSNGAVDVSQVIAGIDWVVKHRADDVKNPIKVLVLAYGTDSTQRYQIDPLSAAVENAWRAGITVVASGGNNGNGSKLLNPASDPFVIAVGAYDDRGTATWADDKLADFTSVGGTGRTIDLVTPGSSIVSLRAPGSLLDTTYPQARLGTDFFVGSGSSQAAAVAGAVAADLLQAHPTLTPDQVKYLMYWSAFQLGSARDKIYGLDISKAWLNYKNNANRYSAAVAKQKHTASAGTGSLEAARGSIHVADGNSVLKGENDIFGSFSTAAWAKASASQTAWNGGSWMGHDWAGNGWGSAPSGMSSWSGRAWSGRAWSGRAWSGQAWSSMTWQGAGWS